MRTLPWLKGELEMLRALWGKESVDEVMRRINHNFGRRRTRRAVQVMASRQKITEPTFLAPDDESLIVALLEERKEAERIARILSDANIADKFELRPSMIKRIRLSMDDEWNF